jgi:hypothetical protein
MLIHWISIVFQFALTASDPQWTCEIAHRDPGVRATFLLYCSQVLPDGTEVASVGKFVPDAPDAEAH